MLKEIALDRQKLWPPSLTTYSIEFRVKWNETFAMNSVYQGKATVVSEIRRTG